MFGKRMMIQSWEMNHGHERNYWFYHYEKEQVPELFNDNGFRAFSWNCFVFKISSLNFDKSQYGIHKIFQISNTSWQVCCKLVHVNDCDKVIYSGIYVYEGYIGLRTIGSEEKKILLWTYNILATESSNKKKLCLHRAFCNLIILLKMHRLLTNSL